MSNDFSGQSAAPSALETQYRHGANWFFWIAGLSLINTAVLISGGDRSFIVGLGVTAIIAVVAAQSEQNVGPEAVMVIKVIAFAICAGIASMFAGFGFFARRRHVWAYILGMVLYLLDGIIYLLIGDLLSAGFHAFVLFQLFNGCKAARALNVESLTPVQPIIVADVEPNA